MSRLTSWRKLTKGSAVKRADLLVLLEAGEGLVEHSHEVQGVSGKTAVTVCEAFCTKCNRNTKIDFENTEDEDISLNVL